jgi:monofunctional biosynthetic peptidoglycan transglycosylase
MKRGRLQTIRRVVAGSAGIGFGCLAYLYLTLPDVRSLARENPETTAFIELRGREARAAGTAPQRRQRWVEYSRISASLKRAVLVAEDAGFWDHEGVDYFELRRSVELAWRRGQLRGASTITQQLAKNLYLSPSRNPLRKFRELIIARRLEAELEKGRIFELYLNVIEWGDGIYGIDAAAQTYFGTSSGGLGPTQSALLAAAIINPRLLNPGRPTARLNARQRLILRRMRTGSTAAPESPVDTHGPIEELPAPDQGMVEPLPAEEVSDPGAAQTPSDASGASTIEPSAPQVPVDDAVDER